jgi:ABC-2 type transport system ATP-binding protein
MNQSTAAIEVSHLKKYFGKIEVLRDVSFSVEHGQIFALLGSNGAGKTTTINILTTLLPADGGTAMVHGIDTAKRPEKVRASISLTGQFAAVDDMLTGRENLELIADLRHSQNSRQTAADLLKQFDLADAADRRAQTYSGGMRRRLDIAMSLIGNPAVIFLDEPTTGLDPEARAAMWQTIKQLSHAGTTIFLTTQYLDEADELADQIALLHKGSIVASGTAQQLKKLVPSGLVELSFEGEQQLQAASAILRKHYAVERGDDPRLTVQVGEGTTKLAELFLILRDAHIEPADFSQKLPTLDDVFFTLIGATNEAKENQ